MILVPAVDAQLNKMSSVRKIYVMMDKNIAVERYIDSD